jgi:L-alanine-DL-glutamate epimerase-like enolase superfamily enzyme
MLAALPRMKIDQVICQVLRVPSVEKKTASSQDVVLVRIRSDDGVEGIGEADASPEVVKAIIDAPFSHNIACGLREILLAKIRWPTKGFGRRCTGARSILGALP